MGVMSGYKLTEVGVIPKDWSVKKLGEIGESLIGLTYRPVDVRQHGVLVLRSSNVQHNDLCFEGNVFVEVDVPQRIMVQNGDILVCVRNGSRELIGKCALLDDRANGMTFGAFMAVFRSSHGKLLNQLFQSGIIKRQINEHLGATINQITNKSLNSFYVPLPPTNFERSAIAETLSDVDSLLKSLDHLITKKRNLKQAAMQQLLTGQVRLPGFVGQWSRNELRCLVSTPITDGPHLTPKFYDTGVPFLSVNNLVDNRINLNDLRYISKEDDSIFAKKCKPKRGDVLLGKAASVGKVAIVESDLDFNIWSPIALVRTGNQMTPRFLYYQLLSADCINQIRLLTNSSSQGNIGMGDIKKIQVSYPAIEEQIAISNILADLDAELAKLEARREKTALLKQGMMQELLTGKTRLI
ncbi:restriction endonuclease subunit S [Polynucleobacter arcticus]|uniref:Type I restriction endonuclease subunit S n=1 Tax=Polynucleobacter arcticus TaxID=1743165 RepID=A0A6M9PXP3_9BURK|nr:restriction endonuclease subunit S [Polynucleobacter arcticus]QKM60723.1 type I restriction endonuclease subunit S [Polynucleobacter arcticus]